ncbi:MAG: hypothetical protein C0620_03335 [Desulfuromonas sp.]|nr:MAG: hypothetical protein C0620_03335 [Desulfuromonas sp.]
MKKSLFPLGLAITVLLITSTLSFAKMAVSLQQKVVQITTVSTSGSLEAADGSTYYLRSEPLQEKALSFEGKQARILFYQSGTTLTCVELAPVSSPEFEIKPLKSPPPTAR